MPNKSTLDEILERLQNTEQELEQEIDRLLNEKRQQFHYQLLRGRVIFEKNMRRLQQQKRTIWWRYIKQAPLLYILSAPIIYGMIIPLVLFDVFITIYQHICFRIYGIPLVLRSHFMLIDRHHLAYLNVIEKINCIYCGYGNGLMAYGREITARTEQFWCPIKHAQHIVETHHRNKLFFDYGDAEAWKKGKDALRHNWENEQIDQK